MVVFMSISCLTPIKYNPDRGCDVLCKDLDGSESLDLAAMRLACLIAFSSRPFSVANTSFCASLFVILDLSNKFYFISPTIPHNSRGFLQDNLFFSPFFFSIMRV